MNALFEPGSLLAPSYEVVAHLSRGRRLDVYDVWSEERACRCVAKTLVPTRANQSPARARLFDEGRLLARLSHPHIVRAYEVTTGLNGRPVLILETLTGETLGHLIGRRKRLPAVDVAWLGLHLCSAVSYLHAQGWLHCDLKPDNIVVSGARAILIDLSIARRPGPSVAGSGTYSYMAPEQVRGDDLNAATDVWGMGAVLFDALTGRSPFEAPEASGDSSEDPLEDAPDDSAHDYEPLQDYPQLNERAPLVRTLRRAPRPLGGMVDACLDPRPKSRPSTPRLAATLIEIAGADPKTAF